MPPTRVMLIHRNRLFVDCLQSVLTEMNEFSVSYRDDSLRLFDSQTPGGMVDAEVILLDSAVCQPNPKDSVERIQARCKAPIIMVVASLNRQVIEDCIAASITGCVLEDSSLVDLTAIIRKVRKGETSFPPEFVNEAFALLGSLARSRLIDQVQTCDLTARELEVMQLIAWERLGNKQIARRLNVSVYTIKNHVHNIIEKLGVDDRFEAAQMAQQKRWLSLLPSR
jgi:two-component system nitrate/nitrite response regulator NarL